jgi:hypothetical protein
LGVRLSGTSRDLVALSTLAREWPDLVTARWVEVFTEEVHLIASPQLRDEDARALADGGVDVIQLTRGEDNILLRTPFDADAKPAAIPGASTRNAQHLLEALRPMPSDTGASPEEACLVMAADSDAPRRTLERLLVLGRDDVLVSEWIERDRRLFVVRAQRPPLYLLMRASEEPDEGITAFARAAPGVWVEWGYTHPLAALAGEVLQKRDAVALVDRGGRWRELDEAWPARSIYDALKPELPAAHVRLTAAPDETRFVVRLRLAAATPSDPELWLFSPEQLLRLEALVDTASLDELGALTLSRLEGPDGVVYLVRERPHAGRARLGLRITELCEEPGFAHVDGADNLYLPVGARLLPAMRRDELKELLALDSARAVIVRERGGAPEVVTVPAVDEQPLSKLVDYVATDRRVDLDRMLEDAVFNFPGVTVQRPKKPAKSDEAAAAPRERKKRDLLSFFRRDDADDEAAEIEDEATAEVETQPDLDEQAALRADARALEAKVASGGNDDEKSWYELAVLKELVDEVDDACASLETALLYAHDGRDVERVRTLASWRERLAPAERRGDELMTLALEDELVPTEAALLGARALAALLGGDALPDGLLPVLVRTFQRPALPVSRRLAWLVLWACHQRTHDKLGLTRAKEHIVGQLNDRGLSETYDLPRFVRYALALDDSGDAGGERNRLEQLAALDRLWSVASQGLSPLNATSAYTRLLFAIGYARAGAAGQARELARPVEDELPAHDRPNRELFRLYLARLAHAHSEGDDEAFQADVDKLLVAIDDDKARGVVQWLRKRSPWLRVPEDPPSEWLRPKLERALLDAERDARKAPKTLRRALEEREYFDYEIASAVSRLLRATLRTGNDALIDEAVGAVADRLPRVSTLAYRARAIGVLLEGSATTGDLSTVHRLLDRIVEIARAPNTPSVRDLLSAVRPALLALRRLGAAASAEHFLRALEPHVHSARRDAIGLAASLADGFLQLGDRQRADALIRHGTQTCLSEELEYIERYEGAAAILDALRHWPTVDRASASEDLLGELSHFKDTFTVRAWFPTHQLLLLERMVDTVVDEVTFSSDRVRAYLDADELALRRRIVSDWNAL